MQYLQQKSGAQTQQEFEAYIQQLGEEGLQKEYAQFMQMIQQQQVSAKRFGGMLNYIGKLRGVCPEGYEMQFFKQGGQICKKCVQKAKMEDGGKTPQNPVDAFKCGRKMKRKAACGTKLPKDKCGSKVEMDKCGKKMKKNACGGDIKKAQAGSTLPTAEPADQRYRGGAGATPSNYIPGEAQMSQRGPVRKEAYGGPNPYGWFGTGPKIELMTNGQDSLIRETPKHTNFVRPRGRIATNFSGDPAEFEIMKRRLEEAKRQKGITITNLFRDINPYHQ